MRYFLVTVENDTISIDGQERPCSVEHLQAALDYWGWGTGRKAVEMDEAAYRASLIERIESAAAILASRRQRASAEQGAVTPIPEVARADTGQRTAKGGAFNRWERFLGGDESGARR
jgi:hypothetical protein